MSIYPELYLLQNILQFFTVNPGSPVLQSEGDADVHSTTPTMNHGVRLMQAHIVMSHLQLYERVFQVWN